MASDRCDTGKVVCPTPLFRFFNAFLWCIDLWGEETHKDHHNHPRRACRPAYKADFPYWLFIRPLESVGLIWALQDK